MGNDNREQRARDAAKAIMAQSFYRIWPADAQDNITAGLLAFEAQAYERAAQIADTARALVDKLDAVHADPNYQGIWTISQTHLGPYKGLTYEVELAALRSAIRAEPSSSVINGG